MIRLSIVTALLLAAHAYAAPPPDADPTLAPWFQSLRQPSTGLLCCSVADCRAVDSRETSGGYEVFIDNKWLPVPPEKVLQRADNPVGRAVVCWTKLAGIMCFVRAPDT
ncbi:MAG TPA: hypothetical protein VKQ29_17925 [Aliidongia sp.]|nr:hypothetical protein [Aliidongia sp.]